MIQVGKIGLTGRIKTCRLHDLIRDLCVSKAREENFIHVSDFSDATQFGRVRRLAVYYDSEIDHSFPTKSDDHLRSLLYFNPLFSGILNNRVILSVFNDLKLLRVLKLEDIKGLKRIPSAIGNLVHLRFLSLKSTMIKYFPSSVENLVCLQTLDLRFHDYRDMKIPNVFGKMEQLRHLYLLWDCQIRQGQKLALGKKLQTLVNVEWGSFDLNSLIGMTSLRKLYIIGTVAKTDPWKNLETFLESNSSRSFFHLCSLSLWLGYGHTSDVVSKFRFVYKLELIGETEKLPAGLLSFPNLIKLKLSSTCLKEDQIATLEKLPHLKVLELCGPVFSSLTSDALVCTNQGFLNLEYLSLVNTVRMRNICLEEGSMPLLRRFHLIQCFGLSSVPEGLQHLANLKELTVDKMTSEFCAKFREDGEDFHKIKHVPSVIITGTEIADHLEAYMAREQDNEPEGCLTTKLLDLLVRGIVGWNAFRNWVRS